MGSSPTVSLSPSVRFLWNDATTAETDVSWRFPAILSCTPPPQLSHALGIVLDVDEVELLQVGPRAAPSAGSHRRCRHTEEPSLPETALLSQEALAKDWDRPKEQEAWSHLRP
jgi:hypothetical protein